MSGFFSIMFLKFIYVVACISASFHFMAELLIYSTVWIYHNLLIYSSDGHLGCFHLSVIVNSAAMIICV